MLRFSSHCIVKLRLFQTPGRRKHEALSDKVSENEFCILFGCVLHRVDNDLRVMRRLVWIVDAGEVFDLSLARKTIHTLHVAFFTDVERRVDEYFDKAIRTNQRTALIAGGAIRADGSAYHPATVACDVGGNETDPPDVCVAVLLRKTESL